MDQSALKLRKVVRRQRPADPSVDAPELLASRDHPSIIALASSICAELAAGAAKRDRERALPYTEMEAVKRTRLHALRVPRDDGGIGASWATIAGVFLALARGDPNVAQAIQSQTAFIDILRADAPRDLQRRLFERINSGALVTNAIAERGGKFYGDTKTVVRRDRGSLRIDGTKYYATGSAFAEFFYVTASDEDDRQLTAIVPRERPGVSVLDDWEGFGQRTTASGTVLLESVEVDPAETFRSPPPEARPWHLQAAAQLMHAAIDAGIAQAAFDDALTLCRKHGRPLRESGVERATDDPYVLHAIGGMSVEVESCIALIERAARLVDVAADAFFAGRQDTAADIAASIAVGQSRILAAQASLSVSERLFEVANATGTSSALGLDRHWRNARAHTTHDPLSYKFKFIGDFLLNGRTPPPSAKF